MDRSTRTVSLSPPFHLHPSSSAAAAAFGTFRNTSPTILNCNSGYIVTVTQSHAHAHWNSHRPPTTPDRINPSSRTGGHSNPKLITAPEEICSTLPLTALLHPVCPIADRIDHRNCRLGRSIWMHQHEALSLGLVLRQGGVDDRLLGIGCGCSGRCCCPVSCGGHTSHVHCGSRLDHSIG